MAVTWVSRSLASLSAGSPLRLLGAQVERARSAYRVGRFVSVAIMLLPWVLAVVTWLMLVTPRTHSLGLMLVEEDGWVENLTFACYLGGGIMGLILAARAARHREHRLLPLYYSLLGLFLVVVAMEEISWGQRVFGWTTPRFFVETNLHEETNLHNLPILENLEYPALVVLSIAGILSTRRFSHPGLRPVAIPSILNSDLVVVMVLAALSLRMISWPRSGSFDDLMLYKEEEVMELLLGLAALAYVWLNSRMLARDWSLSVRGTHPV